MAVSSFALDSAVTGLVNALRAASGFRSPDESGPGAPVYDGAVMSSAQAFSCVVVGSDGDPTSVQRPARFTHEWHDLDATTRESGQVQCAVVVWSGSAGSGVLATQRADAVTILRSVDQTLRASVTASTVGVTSLLWSLVSSGELVQASGPDGTETRLPFVWSYEALNQFS